MNLRDIFFKLTGKYDNNFDLEEKLWIEIENHYSVPGRHYHTLRHLENLLTQLEEIKDNILNWDAVLFAVFYHDIIHKPTKNNNEEKSAALAAKRLTEINISPAIISKCAAMILATKKHIQNDDHDINYFTDADLSVFGQSWEEYEKYFKQIRKEYSVYPDLIYNAGRKKVLDHFLKMKRIYKSNYFYEKLEAKARENLSKERELY